MNERKGEYKRKTLETEIEVKINLDGKGISNLKKEIYFLYNVFNIFTRHDLFALEVKDPTGDIVLQVKLLADRVQFQAKIYDSNGVRWGIGKKSGPEGRGGVIEKTGSAHPSLTLKIEHIFKYPSDLHLGELVENVSTSD